MRDSSRALLSASMAWVIWSAVVLASAMSSGIGVPAPAGQVDRADRLARDGVMDRHAGAGQVLQVLGVVLVAEDVGGLATLQGGADAVRPDVLLGVGEARGELDAVQVPLQVMVGRHPGQHDARRVGQDDADRLPLQVLAQVAEDRHGVADQRGIQVGVADIGESDTIRGHLELP